MPALPHGWSCLVGLLFLHTLCVFPLLAGNDVRFFTIGCGFSPDLVPVGSFLDKASPERCSCHPFRFFLYQSIFWSALLYLELWEKRMSRLNNLRKKRWNFLLDLMLIFALALFAVACRDIGGWYLQAVVGSLSVTSRWILSWDMYILYNIPQLNGIVPRRHRCLTEPWDFSQWLLGGLPLDLALASLKVRNVANQCDQQELTISCLLSPSRTQNKVNNLLPTLSSTLAGRLRLRSLTPVWRGCSFDDGRRFQITLLSLDHDDATWAGPERRLVLGLGQVPNSVNAQCEECKSEVFQVTVSPVYAPRCGFWAPNSGERLPDRPIPFHCVERACVTR